MREIKFRAWDKENSIMITDFQISSLGGVWLYRGDGSRNNPIRNPLDFELLQYTSRKDKNGKEIYEGDVIDREVLTMGDIWKKERRVVAFFTGCFMLKDPGVDVYQHITAEPLDVIGNIYENPELLK